MEKATVYLEAGSKKTFAGALDWPGWSRSGKDAPAALAVLAAYGPRYAGVLAGSGLTFQPPAGADDLLVVEEHPGTTTTDFGAPDVILDSDRAKLDVAAYERSSKILGASWAAFSAALETSVGKELRKGPRGGGRDQEKMIHHVLEAHYAYLRKIGWKVKKDASLSQMALLTHIRQATQEALTAALHGELPETGPRGGELWPVRYFVRRAAWHILDHAWEIEDRLD